jgi:hypothetical protein
MQIDAATKWFIYLRAMNIFGKLWSVGLVSVFVVGSLGGVVVTTQTGCSGTCSTDESNACTTKFTDCTNAAAAAANKADCQACATSYCKCYDDCGSSCTPSEHQGTCDQIP